MTEAPDRDSGAGQGLCAGGELKGMTGRGGR